MAEFLYIHVPFCVRKCIYCDFLSVPYDASLAERYTDALCRELELKKEQAQVLKAVFIGGGTPSILPEPCLGRIFSCLRDNYEIAPSAEITVETNPGTLTASKATMLRSLGVNRLSLGVQSFIDSELKTLGRIHNADETVYSARTAQAAGLHNLSLDLMYGIPGQTVATWKESLSKAISLSPAHISAYELTPEKGAHLFGLLETGSLALPAEEQVLEMFSCAIDTLSASGYEHYEISNYALPGHRCRHNMNYWERGEYLAAGAGAHAFIGGCRSRNTADIEDYLRRLSRDVIPEVESNEITCDEALREFVFLGMRKTEGILLSDAEELGLKLTEAAGDLVSTGLMAISDNTVRLTRKGLPLSNAAIVRLWENLGL